MTLTIDNKRHTSQSERNITGIFIRALKDGKWGSYDIYYLDKESLLAFLRQSGGDNPWAENCVGIILGHGHLHN